MRIFIVDDSILIRNIIKDILASDGSIEVIGEAANGAEAVKRVLELKPDLVIMDFDMPIMNGLEATARIAEATSIPVLIFTRNTDSELPFKALSLGAADLVLKPGYEDLNSAEYVAGFTARLKALASKPPRRKGGTGQAPGAAGPAGAAQRAPAGKPGSAPATVDESRPEDLPRPSLVVVGASTGGPQAVARLLSALPAPFPLPIALVQHIETGFDRGYAEWLSGESGHRVLLAAAGVLPKPGRVYVAPTDVHLVLTHSGFLLDGGAKVLNQRPSVDVLFRSSAECLKERVLGVLLTGMGTDGADGCAAIRSARGCTVVQDEASSLIFGMPKAAIAKGAASLVLPLERIAPFLAAVAERAT